MDNLVREFNSDMKNIYMTAKREIGYNATRFLQLISIYGGLQAAKILISKVEATYGFEKLCEYNRLELSVEYHVLLAKYKSLFTLEERKECAQHLLDYNFPLSEEMKSILYEGNDR